MTEKVAYITAITNKWYRGGKNSCKIIGTHRHTDSTLCNDARKMPQ